VKRLIRVLIAIDQVVNAMLGGDPRETLSGSAGRAVKGGKSWGRWVAGPIDLLFGKNHCSQQADLEQRRRTALAFFSLNTPG
jgi:hypothetical protein